MPSGRASRLRSLARLSSWRDGESVRLFTRRGFDWTQRYPWIAHSARRTVNLFVVLDVHRPWRKVKVTERRAAEDYAQCMRELVDVHYPNAEYIRVVQDNLSTHSAGALYEAFPPAEARRILRRLEFHYTPKHASWLNMVEIEIGVLRGQCLDRRIDDPKRLCREVAAWESAKCSPHSHQMDVHNRQSPRQNGPRIPRHAERVIITVQRY
jgi:hypothetical protein